MSEKQIENGDGKAEGALRTDDIEREFAHGRTAQIFVSYVRELVRIIDHELPSKDAEIIQLGRYVLDLITERDDVIEERGKLFDENARLTKRVQELEDERP